MVTCTLPHDSTDYLANTLKAVLASYRKVWMGNPGISAKKAFGIVGQIKALEVTHGRSGWHPHTHALVLTEAPLSSAQRRSFRNYVAGVWATSVVAHGYREPGRRVGVDVLPVNRAADVARYLTKVEGGWSAGLELARSDVKHARGAGRTPWAILRDFLASGEASDLGLWNEYERATKGRNAVTWSPGLRARLLDVDQVDVTDDDLAAGPRPGPAAARVTVPSREWRRWVLTGEWALQLEALEAIWAWCAAMQLGLGWGAAVAGGLRVAGDDLPPATSHPPGPAPPAEAR
jgi:hypothetical protein